MKNKLLILILAAMLFSTVMPAFADDGTASVWEPIFPSVKNRSGGSSTSEQSGFSSSVTVSSGSDTSGQSGFASSVTVSAGTDTSGQSTFSSQTTAAIAEEAYNDEEQLLFTNFNDDPVKNKPPRYFPLTTSRNNVLVTKVRTYHWNNGNGAAPGTIGIYNTDSGERVCGGQAIGRSSHGVPNVYWETLMECVIYPNITYQVKVSDSSTWSYNDASDGAGMFELYGFDPMPEGYVISPQQPDPAASFASSSSTYSSSYSSGTSYKVPEALTPGMFFEMGYMEQDNDPGNGPDTLDWQVLTVQNDRALVINKRVIDYRPFASDWNSVRWDTSAIRKWLNDDFYNTVFTPEERSRILLVTNENPNNARYGTWGGSATQDHIFLLSYDEALRYFYSNADRKSKRSKTSGTKVSFGTTGPDNTVVWALRSPGAADNMTAQVGADGVVDVYGTYNYSYSAPTLFAIRPAFWMKTKPTAAAKTGFRVRYEANDCLSVVPVDNNVYQPGETVMVMFEPVEYIGGLIFNGWDGDGDNSADYGYSYNSFTMPARDVVLRAVCFQQYQNHYNQYGVTTGPVGTDHSVIPDPGFVPAHTDPLWMDGVG